MSGITWRFLCFHIITGHTGLIFYTSLNISDRGSEVGKLIASTQHVQEAETKIVKKRPFLNGKMRGCPFCYLNKQTIIELSLYRFF